MKSKINRSASSDWSSPMTFPTSTHSFVRKFSNAAAIRARFAAPSLSGLIDPHFLDRLHTPLTRLRD